MGKVEDRKARVKTDFIEVMQGGVCAMMVAAKKAGVSLRTIQNYRNEDEDFDKLATAAALFQSKLRLSAVEDSLVSRIVSGTAPASVTIFWLKANGGSKYKNADKMIHEHEGNLTVSEARRIADDEIEDAGGLAAFITNETENPA